MSLAFETVLTPGTLRSEPPANEATASRLSISVVFTSDKPTIAALGRAGVLASQLGARITLVVPQVVPYPDPLTSPPVLLEFSERKFQKIASESPVEITVHLYLCRDLWETVAAVLDRRSLVVLGGRKTWWPTPEKRLARKLRRAGHDVIFTETE